MHRRVSLFGFDIDAVRMSEAVSRIYSWVAEDEANCRFVVTPNVDHAVLFQQHAGLRQAYSNAAMVLADGLPVVAAARLLGRQLPGRVAGSDLAPALFDAAEQHGGLRVFLLGAAEGVAQRAAAKMARAGRACKWSERTAPRWASRATRRRMIAFWPASPPRSRTCSSSGWVRRSKNCGSTASVAASRRGGAVHRRHDRFSGRRKKACAQVDAQGWSRMGLSDGQRAATPGEPLCTRRLGFSPTGVARMDCRPARSHGARRTDCRLTRSTAGRYNHRSSA